MISQFFTRKKQKQKKNVIQTFAFLGLRTVQVSNRTLIKKSREKRRNHYEWSVMMANVELSLLNRMWYGEQFRCLNVRCWDETLGHRIYRRWFDTPDPCPTVPLVGLDDPKLLILVHPDASLTRDFKGVQCSTATKYGKRIGIIKFLLVFLILLFFVM